MMNETSARPGDGAPTPLPNTPNAVVSPTPPALTGAITGELVGTLIEDENVQDGELVASGVTVAASGAFVPNETSGALGTFTMDAAGSWVFVVANAAAAVQSLAEGASVTETFSIEATDGSTETVSITINGTNDAPIGVDDAFTVTEDAPATTLAVVVNDLDTDSSDDVTTIVYFLTAGDDGLPSGAVSFGDEPGTLVLDIGDDFNFLAEGETETVHFSYSALDTFGAEFAEPAEVFITITGANDAPIALDDVIEVTEDPVDTVFNLLTNDFDPDTNDAITVTAIDQRNTIGTVTDNADGTVTYNPGLAFDYLRRGEIAFDSFVYTITDESGATSSASAVVAVVGQNTPASIGGDTVGFVTEDSATVLETSGVLSISDEDPGDEEFIAVQIDGMFGTLDLAANGSWQYTADNKNPAVQGLGEGAIGIDTFAVETVDGTTASIVVQVTGKNDQPTAFDDSFDADEVGGAIFNVFANDVDPDETDKLRLVGLDAVGAFGFVSYLGAGVFQYTPKPIVAILEDNQFLMDEFSYILADSAGVQSEARVEVTVYGATAGAFNGTVADDIIVADDEGNGLRGHGGDDRLHGLGGDDSLWGGEGADVLLGGDGNDLLVGDFRATIEVAIFDWEG